MAVEQGNERVFGVISSEMRMMLIFFCVILSVVEGILTIIFPEQDYLGTWFSLSYVSTRAVGPGQQIHVETPDDFFRASYHPSG